MSLPGRPERRHDRRSRRVLAAARMTDGGLSQWECLALMRQAFVHSFLSSEEREQMLNMTDHRVFQLLASDLAL